MKTEDMFDKELGGLECGGKFSEGNKATSLKKWSIMVKMVVIPLNTRNSVTKSKRCDTRVSWGWLEVGADRMVMRRFVAGTD